MNYLLCSPAPDRWNGKPVLACWTFTRRRKARNPLAAIYTNEVAFGALIDVAYGEAQAHWTLVDFFQILQEWITSVRGR